DLFFLLPRSTLFPYTTLFRSVLRFDVRHGVRAAFVADQERVAGGEVACAGSFPMCSHEAAIGVLRDPGRNALGDDPAGGVLAERSEEHTSELQSRFDLVCRLL